MAVADKINLKILYFFSKESNMTGQVPPCGYYGGCVLFDVRPQVEEQILRMLNKTDSDDIFAKIDEKRQNGMVFTPAFCRDLMDHFVNKKDMTSALRMNSEMQTCLGFNQHQLAESIC